MMPTPALARHRGMRGKLVVAAGGGGYAPAVSHYILNSVPGDGAERTVGRDRVAQLLRAGMWGVDAGERHRDRLAAGDLALVYLGAPERAFVGRAVLASAVHAWTPSEARSFPRDSSEGVLLARVEPWDPPVALSAVLARPDPG